MSTGQYSDLKKSKKILDLDVTVISLEDDDAQLARLKTEYFPNQNVSLQNAVDIRKAKLENMVDANIINETGYTTINEGRKWHWE